MIRSRVSALAAVVAVALASCAVGPDFELPAPPAGDEYTSETGPTTIGSIASADAQQLLWGPQPSREWWRSFQSDELDSLVRRALANNRTLAASSWTLIQAQELLAARTGERYPRIDATADMGREKYGARFLGSLPKPPPFTYFAIGATISYTLDFTGGIASSIEQQRALSEYRRQQLEAAKLAVSGNTVLQALRIASLRGQIETVESLLERDRANLQLVQEAFDAGSVSRLDVVSARNQLARDATALAPLRQELSAARHALAILVGSTPALSALEDIELQQLTLPSELPVTIPSELAHRRPDILSAEAQLRAATAAVGIATADLYPRIDLTGSVGQQANRTGNLFEHESTAWGVVTSLTAPIFHGGALRAQQRAAIAAMQASASNYQQTVLEAFAQVADSLEALARGAELLQAQASAADAARENVELTQQSYNAGQAGILQVLDAERAYQQAVLGLVKAQAQRHIDSAQLFLALGGGAPAS